MRGTYDVDGDDLAVEVDPHPGQQADAGPEALGLVPEQGLVQGGGQGVCDQDAAGGVQAQPDVVLEHGLDKLLAGLLVLGNVLEGAVDGDEERVVGRRAVEQLHDVLVLVHQLRELGRVLALADELVDGLVRLLVRAAVAGLVPGGGVELLDGAGCVLVEDGLEPRLQLALDGVEGLLRA